MSRCAQYNDDRQAVYHAIPVTYLKHNDCASDQRRYTRKFELVDFVALKDLCAVGLGTAGANDHRTTKRRYAMKTSKLFLLAATFVLLAGLSAGIMAQGKASAAF